MRSDNFSRCNCLIDTGTEVSVLPVLRPNRPFPQQLKSAAANATHFIHFILTDISVSMLGVHFPCHYRLLIYPTTSLRSTGNFKMSTCSPSTSSTVFADVSDPRICALLQKYHNSITDRSLSSTLRVPHARPLPPQNLAVLWKEF